MENISITGAKILFEIPIFGGIPITETQVNSWIVILVIWALCIILTHGMKVKPTSKRQIIAEWIVEKVNGLVHDNMGEKDSHLIPCTQWYPGGVDWDSFIRGLKEIGYRGPLAFETFRGINLLPEDVHEEGLKLVSAIGRSFRRRILAP